MVKVHVYFKENPNFHTYHVKLRRSGVETHAFCYQTAYNFSLADYLPKLKLSKNYPTKNMIFQIIIQIDTGIGNPLMKYENQ